MKALRHIVALIICAAAAVAVVMYEWLNPLSLTEIPLFSSPTVEEVEYDRTVLLLWFVAFCSFCLAWFFWNQRFRND